MKVEDARNPEINSLEWWQDYFKSKWDEYGGRNQTRHFMRRLVANLPAPELAFLESSALQILDWGCAFGDGVDVLRRSFPRSAAAGLDFAPAAIKEARRSYPEARFIHSKDGEIEQNYDVIVTSNCLEHFDFPVEIVTRQLARCNFLYVALVPYDEWPLAPYHRVRFREDSFPERLGSFTRLCARPIEVEPLYWPGKQLLVAYGSQRYVKLDRSQKGSDSL